MKLTVRLANPGTTGLLPMVTLESLRRTASEATDSNSEFLLALDMLNRKFKSFTYQAFDRRCKRTRRKGITEGTMRYLLEEETRSKGTFACFVECNSTTNLNRPFILELTTRPYTEVWGAACSRFSPLDASLQGRFTSTCRQLATS